MPLRILDVWLADFMPLQVLVVFHTQGFDLRQIGRSHLTKDFVLFSLKFIIRRSKERWFITETKHARAPGFRDLMTYFMAGSCPTDFIC